MDKKEKRNICIILILATIISIIIYIAINEAYKFDSGYITVWGASDTLNFYGSFLGFIGTLLLGILALYQNNRLMKMEEKRNRLDLQPFVTVTDWSLDSMHLLDVVIKPTKLYFQIFSVEKEEAIVACLSIFFTNTSNTFVLVNYLGAEVYDNDTFVEKWNCSTMNQKNDKLILHCNDTGEIVFYCSKEKMRTFNGKKIVLELVLENKINDKYKERIDIVLPRLVENNNQWYVNMSPQNYKIMKCLKNSVGEVVLIDENII